VVEVDGRRIGTGHPGATTANLLSDFRSLIQCCGEPIYPQ